MNAHHPITRRTNGTVLALPLLLVALLALTPSHAQAQINYETKDADWWGLVVDQAVSTLDSPIPMVRQQTVKNIAYFVTHYGDRCDFRVAVTRLLNVYEVDSDEATRLLALEALVGIDDDYAMRRLGELVEEEDSPRVRERTIEALANRDRALGTR